MTTTASTEIRTIAYFVTSADARPELEAGVSVFEETFETDEYARHLVDSTCIKWENAPEGTWGVDADADWIIDFDAADKMLAQMGYKAVDGWDRADCQYLAQVEPLNA